MQTVRTKSRRSVSSKKQALRVSVLILVIFLIGLGLNEWMTDPRSPDPSTSSMPSPVTVSKTDNTSELNHLFLRAVDFMQQGEYEQAINLWHQVMLINSEIPEAKVNMGFSLFEMQRYATARDFFISAMEQNAFQANAYFGLALCSEKLGDLEGALGAMKSYIHLAREKQDRPYLRKARSAIWEWEAQLTERRELKH